MALDMIRERHKAGEYEDENIDNFGKDLRTITANAKVYNRDGSMVYRDATTLESYIDVALRALKDDGSLQPKKEEFSADFCRRILEMLKSHEDKSGRQMAELFLELPNEEDYPDYYEEIAKPIAVDIIEQKIESGAYATLESFERDINLMFENAKHYNAEGSDVYLDAEELQQLFWRSIGKNGRGRMAKGKRARKHDNELSQVVHQGQTYQVGDFLHLQNDSDPSKPTIGLIFSLWQGESGVQGLDAVWFLRPEHIVHPYASRFYTAEVVKASGVHEHLVSDIVERCFVLQTKDYTRGRPDNWEEGQSIYICEQRYNDSYKSVSKIKNWASCLPPGHKPGDIQLKLFPQPLVIKKLPSASMVDKAGKRDTSEPASRASTPQDSPSSYASSREITPKPEPPRTTKSNKRKSAQMLAGPPPFQPIKAVAHTVEKQAAVAPPPPPSQARPSLSTSNRYRCNFSNLSSKMQCAATFTSELDLRQHVATEHALDLSNANPAPALKRGRPKKSPSDAEPSAVSPPAPAAAQPIGSTVPNQSGYQQTPYSPYSPTGQYAPSQNRSAMPSQVLSSQSMYSGTPYQPQHQSQPMQYMQQSHQRGMSYPQQAYSQPMQTGQSRPQGYAQDMAYNQTYAYGQSYPMQQQPQHQGYPYSQTQTQYQQGYSSQGYSSHQQGTYSQSYSQPYSSSQHAYPQQQQYGQAYPSQPQQQQQSRNLPPLSSPLAQMDHHQQLANEQQLAQQQRLAQQQQLVQQQYLAQQQQLAQQQMQQQQIVQQQQHQHGGYHQRSMSQPQAASPQQQQQQRPYMPQSPISIIASQPYAPLNSSYQQQAYVPPTSLAYSTSGHTPSLSNASSHGSVSNMTNAMEGVGLGLSGIGSADHGRIIASAVSADGGSSASYPLKGVDVKRQRTDSLLPIHESMMGNGNGIGAGMHVTLSNGGGTTGFSVTENSLNNGNNGSASVVLPGINALTDRLDRNIEVGQ
ncbi:hypothetical protein EDD21DRAFT_363239 [Dissophora ornata]|nr:hypothetical protein EDD21DRAFT_363239 [Dissophora ornata]